MMQPRNMSKLMLINSTTDSGITIMNQWEDFRKPDVMNCITTRSFWRRVKLDIFREVSVCRDHIVNADT